MNVRVSVPCPIGRRSFKAELVTSNSQQSTSRDREQTSDVSDPVDAPAYRVGIGRADVSSAKGGRCATDPESDPGADEPELMPTGWGEKLRGPGTAMLDLYDPS